MFDPWSARNSVLREKVVEHLFLAELSRTLLLKGRTSFEVLRAEFDAFGYDIVVEVAGLVRHIQLKAMRADGKRADVDVNVALAGKPGGCVAWILVDPKTLALGPFLFFGGAPGRPLPALGDKVVRHTKGDGSGRKAVRPELRRIGKGRFVRMDDMDQLLQALFGTGRDRLLRAHLGARTEFSKALDQPWLERVRTGDFGAIPENLDWNSSAHLAHLIDGYALADEAGLGDAMLYADRGRTAAERTGRWNGDALELWVALFLEHRRERMAGRDPGPEQRALLDALCRTLRRRLNA